MPDPAITYHITTAAAPEWAAEVTVGVPKMLAEIERLRGENCALVCRNGDLEAELARLKNALRESIMDHISLAGDYEECGNTRGAMQLRAAANLLGCIFQGGTPATVCPPRFAKEQS